jgi:hypothetical protein
MNETWEADDRRLWPAWEADGQPIVDSGAEVAPENAYVLNHNAIYCVIASFDTYAICGIFESRASARMTRRVLWLRPESAPRSASNSAAIGLAQRPRATGPPSPRHDANPLSDQRSEWYTPDSNS